MKYPKEVQEHIDALNQYAVDENLKEFDILHMYLGKLAYPNGYYDSRFFDLIGYNSVSMTKRNLGKHDGLTATHRCSAKIDIVRIFVDGSTLIRFKSPIAVDFGSQDAYLGDFK